jgi:hypothetical protein
MLVVEDPTLSRQSAHRWRGYCRPNVPATFYLQENVSAPFCYRLKSPQSHVDAGRIR